MSVTYLPAEDVHEALLERTIASAHGELAGAGVQVKLLFAEGGEDKEGCIRPALKDGGYVVSGLVKIPSTEARAAGMVDALLIVDIGDWANYADDKARIALLDHLLSQLELGCDKDGLPKVDTNGRPKLRKRRYDYRIGIFEDVAARNGIHTPGFGAFKLMIEGPAGQLLLPFCELGSRPASTRKTA